MAQLVKTVAGLAIASVKTVNGLAIASVKTINGLDNTSGGGGGVALDGVGTGTASAAGGTSLTWNHTVGAGSNRGLFVGVGWFDGPSTITSVTYNGVAMTQIWTVTSPTISNKSVGFFLVAPASGTNAIVVTFPTAVTEIKSGGSLAFTGVHQTTPTGTAVTQGKDDGTAPSVTVASVGATDIVVDWLAAWAGGGSYTITAGANQTNQYESENASGNSQYFGLSSQAGADGGVMSWAFSAGSPISSIGAVAVKPA